MRFIYGKQDMRTPDRAQESSFLLTNGLGGYASVTAACSVNRADQAILAAAVKAPNERITLVHRLREILTLDGTDRFLTTQTFEEEPAEDGFRHLTAFSYEYTPCWNYQLSGVAVETIRAALADYKKEKLPQAQS